MLMAVNQGVIDDRSTISDFTTTGIFGVYRIEKGATNPNQRNSQGNFNNRGLDARIERRLPEFSRSAGRRATFNGTFQIRSDVDSVYFAQVHGDADTEDGTVSGPVWLLRADRVTIRYRRGRPIPRYDIVLEKNLEPGGRLSQGTRIEQRLDRVAPNRSFELDIVTGYDLANENAFVNISIDDDEIYNARHNYITRNLTLRYGAYGAPGGSNGTVRVANARQTISTPGR